MSSKQSDLEHSKKDAKRVIDPEQLSIESRLPSMQKILFFAASVTFVLIGIYPLVSGRFALWNSGPIANSHRLIAADCKKCHAEPFTRVSDDQCLSCHNLTAHSKELIGFSDKHPKLEASCSACHHEHNGDNGLVLKKADQCVDCHANIKKLKGDSKLLSVDHLASHPQFRVELVTSAGIKERVSLDDRLKLIDTAKIKLNHSVHLKEGLRGPDGPTTLKCGSCHQLDSDFKRIRPISFDSHCRDCHTLGFDEKLPDAQVPHGDAEAVYPALFAEYSKLLLSAGAGAGEGDLARRFPSGESLKRPEDPVSVRAAEQSARQAEAELFTKTGCFLCHSYSEKDPAKQTPVNSHYQIAAPGIPDRWFRAARFSHGAHEQFRCESCHADARKSSETKDILLPGVQFCRECHQQGAGPGFVESGCGECHSYHAAIGFPDEKKHTIADYLRGLMR
jgi:hypothetical protein